MRSLIDITSGMSCSMTNIEASSSSRMRSSSGPKASASRWAMPAVGSSRHSIRTSVATRQASSTIRRMPVDSSLTNRMDVSPQDVCAIDGPAGTAAPPAR